VAQRVVAPDVKNLEFTNATFCWALIILELFLDVGSSSAKTTPSFYRGLMILAISVRAATAREKTTLPKWKGKRLGRAVAAFLAVSHASSLAYGQILL